MKKTILLLLFSLVSLVFTTSCSNDDSDNSSNQIFQSLLGKWYFEDPSTNPTINNSFTFNSNGQVIYSYWEGSPGNNYDSETGTFSVQDDILTMIFPENVSLTFVQKVVFINQNKMEFLPTGNPNEDAYEGDYFKEGYSPSPTDELKLTFTGSAFTDQCTTTGSPLNNSVDVNISFLSNGNLVSQHNFQENSNWNLNYNETLDGNVISLKVKLQNFNPNDSNSGKGTGVDNITVKIENSNNEILFQDNIGMLLICTDTWHEVIFTYNKTTGATTTDFQTHSF